MTSRRHVAVRVRDGPAAPSDLAFLAATEVATVPNRRLCAHRSRVLVPPNDDTWEVGERGCIGGDDGAVRGQCRGGDDQVVGAAWSPLLADGDEEACVCLSGLEPASAIDQEGAEATNQ